MKFAIPCPECSKTIGQSNPHLTFRQFDVLDESAYIFRCDSGHEIVGILQQQKPEILFEIGALAILDGYPREAISSFTASLERFYEFAIEVMLCKAASDGALFEASWKLVAAQSERQLGAFIFLWTTAFGETPSLPPNDHIKLRNAVVHKGKIPTKEEAINYGEAILSLVRQKVDVLQSRMPAFSKEVIRRRMLRQKPGEQTAHWISVATLLSLWPEADHPYSSQGLRDYLAHLPESREFWDSVARHGL